MKNLFLERCHVATLFLTNLMLLFCSQVGDGAVVGFVNAVVVVVCVVVVVDDVVVVYVYVVVNFAP